MISISNKLIFLNQSKKLRNLRLIFDIIIIRFLILSKKIQIISLKRFFPNSVNQLSLLNLLLNQIFIFFILNFFLFPNNLFLNHWFQSYFFSLLIQKLQILLLLQKLHIIISNTND